MGWYIKLLEFDHTWTPECYRTLIGNIKHRDSFSISFCTPDVIPLNSRNIDGHTRRIHEDGTLFGFVHDLGIARCSFSNRNILVGTLRGRCPKMELHKELDYCIGIVGAHLNERLREIDFFSVQTDFSDKYEPFSVTQFTSLKDWWEMNKQ